MRGWTAGLAAWAVPGLALADAGCGSTFESWSCFRLTVTVVSFIATPVGLLGAGVLVAVAIGRKLRGKGLAAALGMALLALPLAVASFLLVSEVLLPKLGDAAWLLFGVGGTALLQFVYVLVAMRAIETLARRSRTRA